MNRHTDSNLRILLLCIGLAVLVAAVYHPVIGHSLLTEGDTLAVRDNPAVEEGFTAGGIAHMFAFDDRLPWYPLTTLSLMVDGALFGGEPAGFHLTNIMLHAAVTVLLFLVLYRYTGMLWRSAFVAAVFAVHPRNVETVAWVAQRQYLLGGFMFLFALSVYLSFLRKPGVARYIALTIVFIAGMMAHPFVAFLPVALVLLDYWPVGRFHVVDEERDVVHFSRKSFLLSVMEKSPLLVLGFLYLLIFVIAGPRELTGLADVGIVHRIQAAAVGCVTYLVNFVRPWGLSFFHPYPGTVGWVDFSIASVVLAVITAGVLILRKRLPFLVFGWFWFLLGILPMLGLLQIAPWPLVADRFAYLPYVGLMVALVWLAAYGWEHTPLRMSYAAFPFMVVLVLLAGSAYRHTGYWRESRTVFAHAIARNEDNWYARRRLGEWYSAVGYPDSAVAEYEKALSINPDDAEIYNNIGLEHYFRGEVEKARPYFERAIDLDPELAAAYNNLGLVEYSLGNPDEAEDNFRNAILYDPDMAEAYNNLGLAQMDLDEVEEAERQFRKALAIDGDYVNALHNLGEAHERLGNPEHALNAYATALRHDPDNVVIMDKIGVMLSRTDNIAEAEKYFRRAIDTDSTYVRSYYNLAILKAIREEYVEAERLLEKALELDPEYSEAMVTLSRVRTLMRQEETGQ